MKKPTRTPGSPVTVAVIDEVQAPGKGRALVVQEGCPVTLASLDKLPALPLDGESEDALLGRQLTTQWDRVKASRKEDLIFGAMMLKLRARVGSARGTNSPSRGPTTKGEGVKGWLAQYAPAVSESIAQRLMEIAEGIIEHLKIGKKTDLEELLSAQIETLSDSLAKRRAQIEEMIEGRSQRQLLLQFGGEAKMAGGARQSKKPKLTAEEQQAAWEGAARKAFVQLANDIGRISRLWMSPNITDAERELCADHAEALAQEMRAWVALPKNKRSTASMETIYTDLITGGEK